MTPFFENYKFNTFYDVKSLKEKLNKSSFKKVNKTDIHFYKEKIPSWEKFLK